MKRWESTQYKLACLRREHEELVNKLDEVVSKPDAYILVRQELDWNEIAQEELRQGKTT